MELNAVDADTIRWDLEQISIFFDRPLQIEVPVGETSIRVSAGTGLGGYSWSLFQRGFNCVSCGKCCIEGRGLHRRLWFWFDNEPRPDGLEPKIIFVNGEPLVIWCHFNTHPTQCDFLQPMNDEGFQYCGIHTVHPIHCSLYPGTAVYRVGKDRIPLLSRRLPGRNWRWPQCPVDVAIEPLRVEDTENDYKILTTWQDALDTVPGSRFEETYKIWEANVAVPPRTSIIFADVLK